MGKNLILYLLHLEAPIGNPEKKHGQAQHYLGITDDLEQRMERHLEGRGNGIIRKAVEEGIPVKLARTWKGMKVSRAAERHLKNQHHNKRFCPYCNPDGWQERGNL